MCECVRVCVCVRVYVCVCECVCVCVRIQLASHVNITKRQATLYMYMYKPSSEEDLGCNYGWCLVAMLQICVSTIAGTACNILVQCSFIKLVIRSLKQPQGMDQSPHIGRVWNSFGYTDVRFREGLGVWECDVGQVVCLGM